MVEDGKFKVEKFNGQNYQLSKMQMEYYLYQKDLFLPLGGIAKKSTTMKDKEWEVLDIKALGMIRLYLAASVAFNISKEKTTLGASFHVTPHRNVFQDYVQADFGPVYLGDDEPCQIV
jgi:hypothetical protein